ncbi:hypothetical protein K501DRAFT_284655 [Backusella circina FSU 941]|nr:hypothetical protein K501DRAFT_284655 [Backusella circina FSU 941]
MPTDEEIKRMIETLQEQIKHHQEQNNELLHDMDSHTERQKELRSENEYLRQKMSGIQMDNANYSNTQARLETQLYAQEQDLTDLRKEIQQLTKGRKDAEKKLSSELQDFENDRMKWQQREADLYNQIRSLSVNSGEPRTPRTPRRRSVTSTTLMSPFTNYLDDIDESSQSKEAEFPSPLHLTTSVSTNTLMKPAPKLAAIDSSYAREAKIAQRTIKAQDKLILDLKGELEKQKSLLKEHQNETQQQSLKIVHLEHEIQNVKQLNRSLQEDNESYQILLHEKTMNGEFMMNPIMQVDEIAVSPSVSTSQQSVGGGGGLNLAAELNMAAVPDWNQKETDQTISKLSDEVKQLQDTNRALQLYMNKILMKIINNKQLEDVLSIDQPKPKSTTAPSPLEIQLDQKRDGKRNTTSGPVPTKTVSSTVSSKTPPNRQRRRTISYWGSKQPPPPPTKNASEQEITQLKNNDDEHRRHSSILGANQPEKSSSTTTSSSSSGGWAKALRRMSVIGWSSSNTKEEPPVQASVSNDSAVGSLSEEEAVRKSHSSGSSTPSLRRSNELGTLAEEE